MTVTGERFTPNSKYTLSYLGYALVTGRTTESGTLSASLIVPFVAQRGTSHDVTVKDGAGLLASSVHFVPKAAIKLSISEAFAAETISITGTGFLPKSNLASVTFSRFPSVQLFSETPLPKTDGIGNITVDVQVPWPSSKGTITFEIGGIVVDAPLIIRPPAITATRKENTVLVVGEGFPPNSQTIVSVDIVVKTGPNIFTDENGNVSIEITTFGETKTPDGNVHVSVGEFLASAQIQ